MSINNYIAADRCPCCGHKLSTWTPKKIVEAFRAHVATHGRVPTATDWAAGTPDHPAQTTVCTMFGSWNRGVAAAGLAVRAKNEREPVWTRQLIVDALLDHLGREGCWPTWRDWARAKGRRDRSRPAAWSVVREFGSWSAAIEFASGRSDPRFRSRALREGRAAVESVPGLGVESAGGLIPLVTDGDSVGPGHNLSSEEMAA